MPVVKIEPTAEHPVPFNNDDDPVPTLLEQLAVAGNTAELQVALGAPLEMDEDTLRASTRLLEQAVKTQDARKLNTVPAAYGAAQFLRAYGQQLALDVAQVRAAITSKLLEIANCGETKFELKALELLGKHSDIGLFTERSEVTINYKDPQDLENAIKARVKRLLNAEVIDATPLYLNLDEELGVATPGLDSELYETPENDENGTENDENDPEEGDEA